MMAEDKFFGGLKVAPLLVSDADVRLCRGAVVRVGPAPSVLVPAGTPGSFLIVHTAKKRVGKTVQIVRTAAWLLEEHLWVPRHLSVAFFSGNFPEYDLTLVADRQRLLATSKRLSASAPRFSDAVLVPDFLTNPVGIMTVIRKLPDRDALLKFLNLHVRFNPLCQQWPLLLTANSQSDQCGQAPRTYFNGSTSARACSFFAPPSYSGLCQQSQCPQHSIILEPAAHQLPQRPLHPQAH